MRTLILITAIVVCSLSGCGGGISGPGGTGRAEFRVDWPARSRLIPAASNSIKVEIGRGGSVLTSRVIPRPSGASTATVTIENLPVGELTAAATAHPNADGTGTAQATGSAPLQIVAGQATPFTITMESTIVSVKIAPPAGPIRPGDVVSLQLTAKDAGGNLVLVSPASLEWTTSNPAVATVSGSGGLTAGTNGSAIITVLERESELGDFIVVNVEGGRPIAYEPFNYPLGAPLLGQSGGTGWAGAWGQNGSGTASVIDSGLSYLRLQARNNSARTTSTQPIGHTRALGETIGTPGTTRYFSILLRPLDAMNAGTPTTYFGFGFGTLHIGKGGNHASYLIENAGGGGAAVSAVPAAPNTTIFLVVRATFMAGNDRIELWVNPTPGQPLPPTPSAVKQDTDMGLFSEIGLGASIRCHFDELRVGETYGDVAPILQLF